MRGRKGRVIRILLLMLLFTMAGTKGALAEKLNTSQGEVLSGGIWKKAGKGWKYQKADGTYAKNGFKKIGKKWFFFKRNGKLAIGLKKLNGKTYYFAETGKIGKIGRMCTGLIKAGEETYYFATKGAVGEKGARLESAWKKVNGKQVYFRHDGTMGAEKLTEKEFIKKIGKLAKADMKRSGVLASVTIAQAILESGYGTTKLALEGNNLFGMKASLSGNTWKSKWDGATWSVKTLEYLNGSQVTMTAAFRAYPDYAASVRDHSDYLTGAKNGTALRYQGIVGNKSYRRTIQIIKQGGYATSPTYVSTVVKIIKQYKLTRYDK